MAGSKINDYSIGDSNIQSVMLTLDKAFKGFHQVSLTNYNTTDESAIAAGSVVEVNGALYKFDSNESITGSPSDGTVYIYLVPSGDTITAAYTNTAPTWSDSKQGWYGTGGNANYRYLEFKLILESSSWIDKRFLRYDEKFINFETEHNTSFFIGDNYPLSGGIIFFSLSSFTKYYKIKKTCCLFFSLGRATSSTGTATIVVSPFYYNGSTKTYFNNDLVSLSVGAGGQAGFKYLYNFAPCYIRIVFTDADFFSAEFGVMSIDGQTIYNTSDILEEV